MANSENKRNRISKDFSDLDPKENYKKRVELLNKIQPFYFMGIVGLFVTGAIQFGFWRLSVPWIIVSELDNIKCKLRIQAY